MSPRQSVEIFSLSAAGPTALGIHGAVLARGEAHAGASFRRGIDLSAGFELEANLDASMHDAVAGSLGAGAGVRAGLALQAAMPLDLFSEAGLVARLQAQAEAAAHVTARLGLGFDVFRNLVRERLGPSPLAEVLDVFLEEAVVEAGFWGRASFAAEVLGEATFTGSLLPGDAQGSGFTFSLQYGVGFGFGTGTQLLVNVGFDDPRRFIQRLADQFTLLVLREGERIIESLPQAQRGPARATLPLARVVLPLATRSAFEAGFTLASGAGSSASAAAARSVVEAFGQEAQELVLKAIFDFGSEALADVFGGGELIDAWVGLDDQPRERVRAQLEELQESLGALEVLDPSHAESWFDAVLDCVDSLGSLIDLELIPARSADLYRNAMAYVFSSATLLRRLAQWMSQRPEERAELFSQSPATVPDNSPIAAHISAVIQKPAGSALTLADMVRFLLGANPVSWIRERAPVSAGAIDWLETLLQLDSDEEFLEYVLTELLPPDQSTVQSVLGRMSTSVETALRRDILPKLMGPLRQNSDHMVRAFLDGVILPPMAAFPTVVLGQLTELDEEEDVLRFREALSAMLLQTFARLLLTVFDVLLERALAEGKQALRTAGRDVEEFAEQHSAFGAVAAVASRALFGLSLTPDDLAALLRLAADTAERWNDNHREDMIEVVYVLFALGMANEATRNQTFQTLTGSDAPALEADLTRALDRVRDSTLDMVGFAGPRLIELLALHYVNEIKAVAEAIYEGAKAVVAAVEQAVTWLAQEIDRLRQKLEELAKEAARLGAQIASDIAALAEHLKTLVSQIVDSIRAAGWSLIDAVIPEWVPEWGVDIAKAIYDALFDAVKWVLSIPLTALNLVAGWVRDLLTSLANGSALDAGGIKSAIRNKILGVQAYELSFTIKMDLGFTTLELPTVSIPAGDILWTIANAVLGDGTFDATVDGCATDAAFMRQVEAQRIATEKALNQELTKAQAQNVVGALTTGQPVRVTIHSPKGRSGHAEAAALKIEVAGANRSFVDPPLGVPRRIAVRLNGREYDYSPDRWTETPSGLVMEASIPLPVAVPVVSGVRPGTATATAVGPTATGVGPTASAAVEGPAPAAAKEIPAVAMAISAGTPVLRSAAGDRRWYEVSTSSVRLTVAEAARIDRGPGTVEPDPGWRRMPEPEQPLVARVVEAHVIVQPLVAPSRPRPGGAANVIEPGAVAQELRTEAAVVLGAAFDAANIAPGTEPLPPIKALVGEPGINALQVAVSDGKQETESDAVVFFLGVRPPKPRGATIVDVEANPPGRDVPAGEHVLIRSKQAEPLDMTGWLLRDLARHVYRFPTFVLAPGEEVRVWTKAGEDGSHDLYWGRRAAVWNNPGDSAVLQDAAGREVSRFTYTAL